MGGNLCLSPFVSRTAVLFFIFSPLTPTVVSPTSWLVEPPTFCSKHHKGLFQPTRCFFIVSSPCTQAECHAVRACPLSGHCVLPTANIGYVAYAPQLYHLCHLFLSVTLLPTCVGEGTSTQVKLRLSAEPEFGLSGLSPELMLFPAAHILPVLVMQAKDP